MRLELSVTSKRGRTRMLVADAEPSVTVRQVIGDLLDAGDVVFHGSRLVDLDRPPRDSGVHSGARLSVEHPQPDEGWPLRDGPVLAVVGGAAAGRILPLRPGRQRIGRAAPSDLVVADPTLSTQHAEVELTRDGIVRVTDLGSTNGSLVRGTRLKTGPKAAVPLAPGERFVLGQAVLQLLAPVAPDGSVEVGSDGQARFNRVVRFRPPAPAARIAFPTAPPDPPRSGFLAQVIGSLAMVAVGVTAALLLRNVLFAALGVVGPLVFVGTAFAAQRGTRRDSARRQKAYDTALASARQQLTLAAETEAEHEWSATPDPATAACAALGPTSRLWSVDPQDESAALVRVGTHDRPARLGLQDAGSSAPIPVLRSTPVTVDLRAHPVLGLAGDPARARAAARALVHQVVTARSPDDLAVVHVSADGHDDGWQWLRWLPHVRGLEGDVHAVSPGPEALSGRLDELVAVVKQRQGLTEFGFGSRLLLPEILVVLDGAGALRTRQSVVTVLRDGPALGIRVIAVEAVAARLPAECAARLIVDPDGSGAPAARLEQRGSDSIEDITVDLLAVEVAEATARALAPLIPLGGVDGGGLPDEVRLSDLYGLADTSPADVLDRWGRGEECRALLGIDENGAPAVLDLVDDGPHALIAGATGSGKSELMRSLLAGLVLSAPPADLSLLLIDFKGGGAFGKLAELPHVVGYADDQTISGHLANRLLDSLKAELDLRKQRFKLADNADGLTEYRAARRRMPQLESVSRLVIVVDEFAELKDQQPDFVDGLVNVARVGRSLGVHLILATQRPGGVVTPQIRDNANLRISLRVLDATVSHDLVGTAVAASFPNRAKGRAAVLVGEGQPTVVQTAYASAPLRTVRGDEVPPPSVRRVPWEQCGVRVGRGQRAEAGEAGATELTALCALLEATARQHGLGPARKPWHPPLGERVALEQLLGAAQSAPPGWTPFAVEDRPKEQRTTALALTLGSGNLAIVGGRGSGRSTALRTLAASLATRHTADELHLHVIDQTPASVMRSLTALPHCGVVATRAERHRTERLITRLTQLLEERSALLSRHGAATLTELRRRDPGAPPFVVVMIDGWDQFVQTFQGIAEGVRLAMIRLAEEGPAVGIQLVVAGGKAVGQSRLLGVMESVLCLRFEQREDMADFDVPVRELPAELPPGRGYRTGTSNAVQVALLDGDAGSEGQNAALGELAARLAPPVVHVPLRLDDLPTRITWAEAAELPGAETPGARSLLVGVGGDRLGGRVVDLDRLGGPFVVVGPAGSGRTAALALLSRQLVARGAAVLVAPGGSDEESRFPGAQIVDPTQAVELVEDAVLLVDDAGRVPDDAALLLAALADRSVRVVLSGDHASMNGWVGWKREIQNGTAGLLFSPRMQEGSLAGAQVSIDEAFTAGPGRAYLSLRGAKETVQVPWAG